MTPPPLPLQPLQRHRRGSNREHSAPNRADAERWSPGEAWREVDEQTFYDTSDVETMRLYPPDGSDRDHRFFARVRPIPIEAGYWRDANGHVWTAYDDGSLDDGWGNPVDWSDPDPPMAPFVKLEPSAATAKAVLDRVDEVSDGTWEETREKIAREFGVSS